MLDGMVLAAMWFGLFVVSHVTVFHLRRIEQRTRMVLMLYLGCLAGFVLTVLVFPTDVLGSAQPGVEYRPLNVLVGLLTMGCLFVLYMPTYYTFATSQSVQAVTRVYRAPNRRLPLDDVIEVATSDAMLRQRLDSMVASGNLVVSGGRYFATQKARRVGSVFGALQRLWRLDPVG